MFKFNCPSCRKTLSAAEELGGQLVECVYCRSNITVPHPPRSTASVRVVEVLPALNMLSPNLAAVLSSGLGKYVRWAKQLDADTLAALLWAIGEFASRWQKCAARTASFQSRTSTHIGKPKTECATP